MKKIIISVGFVLLSIISQKTIEVVADDSYKKEIKTPETREQQIRSLVKIYAKKYNVSESELMRTLRNENNIFQFDLQSGLKYKKGNRWGFPEGTREKSYGVAQIHLPDHPDITYEQAIDPRFSIEYMASEFSKGRQKQWMGYSK